MSTEVTAVSMTTRIVSLLGIATDVYSLSASRPSRLHIVVVPGNPGCAQFYIPFVQKLHTQLDGGAHVHTLSYAGHELDGSNGGTVYPLSCQAPHKLAFVEELQRDHTDAEFVLFGHSLGAWVALEVCLRCFWVTVFYSSA